MKTITVIIRLARPWHWYKNLFVLLPAFLLGVDAQELWIPVLMAFMAMSLASSANYVLNDIRDRHRDQNDPERNHRPLANKVLSPWSALIIYAALVLTSAVVAGPAVLPVLLLLVIGFIYSLWIKGVHYLELGIISLDYVIRVWAGTLAISYTPEGWLYAGTFSLAFFVIAAKRFASLDTSHHRQYARILNIIILAAGFLVICIPTWFAFISFLPATVVPLIGIITARYYYVAFHQRKPARHPHLMLTDIYIMLPSLLLLFLIALHVY